MSSQNAFPGPNAGRLPVRPTAQANNSQPSWVNPESQPQTGRPQPPANAWPPQQQPAQGYPAHQQPGNFGGRAAEPQQPAYGQWNDLQQGNRGGYPQGGAQQQPDPYAPQFEPYVPPSRPNFAQPQQQSPSFAQPQAHPQTFGGQQPQQAAPQWQNRNVDPRSYDAGNYGAQQSYPSHQPAAPAAQTFGQQQYHDTELSANDWAGPHDNFAADPYQQHNVDPHLGFGQADGGELEPVYNEDELEYEDEEDAPRSRRPIMILAALIGAIVIGGGVAYGYKKFAGGSTSEGEPPVVKSDDFAARTKPADAGGKQFPYSDTKIMGRLGDGTSSASAEEANSSAPSAPSDGSDNSSANSASDEGGARKVSTLVVGRDGTIMAPPGAPQNQSPPQSSGDTAVPGTSLVDVFGQQHGSDGGPSAGSSQPVVPRPINADDAAPPKAKPVKVAKVNTINSAAGSADDSVDAPPPPPKKKLKKVARAEPTVENDATSDAAPVTSSGGGAGFVAVLASVPHSASSRIDALKRFADMQQKYSSALAGKTPDIASANLTKGTYDRLVVGPPGSREEASNVCAQLKAAGYNGCWVTSY